MDIEKLVVRNADWLRAKARRYYSDPADADDLASETIYKCLCNARNFNSARAFKPWALTIMENTFKSEYRHRKCVVFTDYKTPEQYTASDQSDDEAEYNATLEVIRECNRKSECVEAVMLYAKGYDYNEIAEMFGIPIGTVRSRIAYGRKILRKALM